MECTHSEGEGHDCEYVDMRNRFLPAAVRYADNAVGSHPGLVGFAGYRAEWAKAFMAEVDRLWSEHCADQRPVLVRMPRGRARELGLEAL